MATKPRDIQGFHLMAKPVGAACNLACTYCFYLEKQKFYPEKTSMRMDQNVLQAYVKNYIAAQATPEVEFTWQGGEPTLMGLDFFRTAVALQKQYANGKTIKNTLQTNGTLIDEAWCEFLAQENFLVGISLDGPAVLNDTYRPDKQGRSTFNAVVQAIKLLQQHGVEFNVLVTVARDVAKQPVAVYEFLCGLGVRYIQFNPVVERVASCEEQARGLDFAPPPQWPPPLTANSSVPSPQQKLSTAEPCIVSNETVDPLQYGIFLSEIFDLWLRRDVGTIHVMNFEWALASWCQRSPGVCLFAPRCGRAAIVEHDGSVYACDHFMYPGYRLGNVQIDDVQTLLNSTAQRDFGAGKETALPPQCQQCRFLFACHGECPKNRFSTTAEGHGGLNYLCPGYFHYFNHITPAMNGMAKLLAHGQDAALIMQTLNHPQNIPISGHRPKKI